MDTTSPVGPLVNNNKVPFFLKTKHPQEQSWGVFIPLRWRGGDRASGTMHSAAMKRWGGYSGTFEILVEPPSALRATSPRGRICCVLQRKEKISFLIAVLEIIRSTLRVCADTVATMSKRKQALRSLSTNECRAGRSPSDFAVLSLAKSTCIPLRLRGTYRDIFYFIFPLHI